MISHREEKKNVKFRFVALLSLAAALGAHAQDIVETVKLTIQGGPNAGAHQASSAKGGCSSGLAGAGSWGNALSDPKGDPKKLNSVQLVVPDAKKAASGTGEFLLTVGFGPITARGAEYSIDTRLTARKKVGSGRVTVHDAGNTATVDFSVTTAEGVKIDGTIDCRRVIRAGT
jgi:hypothetical protein